MARPVPIRRALVSVSDKTDLIPFVRGLREWNIEIVSTGGTARTLTEAGIEVLTIEQVTGFPEMMDGRVKTLHPSVHGALLGRRDLDTHVAAMRDHNIVPIDLVCVNLYPFEQTIANPDVQWDDAIEQIDIGGPSMLRSSAKNHEFVTVVTSPAQYDRVVTELQTNEGATTLEMRRDLAAAAFMRTAEYDTAISAWMCSRRDEPFPSMLQLAYAHVEDLRYGENPHQKAALYSNPASTGPSVVRAEMLHGKPLSYNNLNDAAAALHLVMDLHHTLPEKMASAVIKHTNPCGSAVADTLEDAFELAYAGDPLAAYGGILAVSRTLDVATATRIAEGQRFLEVILAPSFDPEAAEILGARWKNVRLLAVGALGSSASRKLDYRSIAGGLLVQDRDTRLAQPTGWTHAAGPAPDDALMEAAAHLWTTTKHLTSNAIAIGSSGVLIGAGAGQMDRVNACRIAIEKAGADRITDATHPVIAASDAFFPFDDGPALLIDAGVTCLIHPGGSKRDEDTFRLCEERGVTCLLTGVRHFRH